MIGSDTIAAVATGEGGAIAVIRISGPRAIEAVDAVFRARSGKKLSEAAGYTVHLGTVADADGETVDEVLVSVFRAPHSYTGEDSVEISCHASPYVKNRLMQILARAGVRSAGPGEFTVRAFLAGKMDLAQAEAVADLIASAGRSQHSLAMGQMKGGFSSKLTALREELLAFSSLLELELDFAEEDVEFADRDRLAHLAGKISDELDVLISSFALGNVIREGIPVAIVGRPNAGKSTLLNALVGDDRALVSHIAGTTRDRIEECVNIDGVIFRFIDTAGLRPTDDILERMGIERTIDAISKARLVLLVVDAASSADRDVAEQTEELGLSADRKLCVVFNKIDKIQGDASELGTDVLFDGVRAVSVAISAKKGLNLDSLKDWLRSGIDTEILSGSSAVVSNARHYEALIGSRNAVKEILRGIDIGNSTDLLAESSRDALHYLGIITGEITTDEILNSIFSKFCIGK